MERQREMGSMDEDGANRLVEGGVEDAYKLGEAVVLGVRLWSSLTLKPMVLGGSSSMMTSRGLFSGDSEELSTGKTEGDEILAGSFEVGGGVRGAADAGDFRSGSRTTDV